MISIYQSQYCSILQPVPVEFAIDAPPLGTTTAMTTPSSSEGQYPDSEENPEDTPGGSLDDPQPILKAEEEEEAMKNVEELAEVANIIVEETTHKRRKRIKQVNATLTTETTYVKDQGAECRLTSTPIHAKTLARFFVVQRDGRQQLRDFVTHYTKVLPYNSIVILDHAGTDEYTKTLLQQYASKGAHVWRCKGQFKAKAAMWTKVIRAYAKDTGFVFPVDIDELLAVKVNNALQWDLGSFKDALYALSKNGKPYKMNWIESVPAECHVHMKDPPATAIESATTNRDDDGLYASAMCDIRYVKTKKVGCMDKTFSRGIQFTRTDTGNHYGGTKRFPKLSKKVCEDRGLENVYEISTLALIHLKEKTFEDWLLHGLRGATDRGFNSNFAINCRDGQQSLHYCRKWEKITKAKFSPYELRKIYVEDVCPDPQVELMPAQDAFCERS